MIKCLPMKMNRSTVLGCVVAIGLVVPGLAQATTYSAAGDFSLASNANGVWSYLYSNTLLPNTQTNAGVEDWWSGQGEPNSIIVGHAVSSATSVGTVQFGTNYLTLDPESQTVDVRFTAPSTGVYTITGQFSGADSQTNCGGNCAAHPVLITDSVDGTIFGPNTISTDLQTYAFNLVVSLTAGEKVDFLAQTGTSGGCKYCNLSTGLQATISSTPLPATWLMLLSGFVGLGFFAYRGTKKNAAALAAA